MKKRVFTVSIAVFLGVCYIARVIYLNINSEGFRVPTESHNMGEVFWYADFEYQILDFEIMDKNALNEKFGSVMDNVTSEDAAYLLATVKVRYQGDEKDKLSHLFSSSFESGSWRNGVNSRLGNRINSENMRFDPGGEKTLYAIAEMFPVQFSKSEWKKIYQRKYSLVLETYPKKVEVKCN